MATQTTNYGLTKPSYNETADIGVINSNMDIIDAKMKEIDNKAGSGGTSITVDSELSDTSTNPVQNKVITYELSDIERRVAILDTISITRSFVSAIINGSNHDVSLPAGSYTLKETTTSVNYCSVTLYKTDTFSPTEASNIKIWDMTDHIREKTFELNEEYTHVHLYCGDAQQRTFIFSGVITKNNLHTYTVEKNGNGDFTRLIDAIEEATKYLDSKIYIGAGTWDLIEELGNTYVESCSSLQRGIYLSNRVHLIGSSETLITCKYTGSNTSTKEWFSAFNSGPYGFTLENIRLETSNIRYSIHDERDADTDAYTNIYKNCNIKHTGGLHKCIGGGLGCNGHIIVDGCIFDLSEESITLGYPIVSWHNTAGNGRSMIEMVNNYIKGNRTAQFSWYGNSTEKSTILCSNNSFGAPLIVQAETEQATIENIEVFAWNNEVRA